MKMILFDFDGVMVDTFAFCYHIIAARDQISEEEYRARFEGNINAALKKAVLPTASAQPFDFFGQYTPELMACHPDREVVEVVRELAKQHTLIIISSTISQPISEFLELHGLRALFKEILGNDIEKSKVKKIQDVLRRYGIEPSATVFITDTLGDIREAKTCGVPSIAVTWGFHPAKTLEKGAPYKIIDHPRQIIEVVKSMGDGV